MTAASGTGCFHWRRALSDSRSRGHQTARHPPTRTSRPSRWTAPVAAPVPRPRQAVAGTRPSMRMESIMPLSTFTAERPRAITQSTGVGWMHAAFPRPGLDAHSLRPLPGFLGPRPRLLLAGRHRPGDRDRRAGARRGGHGRCRVRTGHDHSPGRGLRCDPERLPHRRDRCLLDRRRGGWLGVGGHLRHGSGEWGLGCPGSWSRLGSEALCVGDLPGGASLLSSSTPWG